MTNDNEVAQDTPAGPSLSEIAIRIRSAVCKISEQVHTSIRAVLDSYVQHISPALSLRGDSYFPRAARRHPVNPDFSTSRTAGDLLFFHVGNAILAYYDAVRGNLSEHLLSRVIHLEEIAANVKDFVPYGSDLMGWCLLSKAAAKAATEALEKRGKHNNDAGAAGSIPEVDGAGKATDSE